MGINWKVRVKSKWFWVALIPALLLLIQQLLNIFGIQFDFQDLQERLLAIVESAFLVLGICGVIVDPTTKGFGDSDLAMTYTEPRDSSVDEGEED